MQQTVTHILISSLVAFLMMSTVSYGATFVAPTQFGRYLTVTNAPKLKGDYDLDAVVERQFKPSIKTLGEAITHTLMGTGYTLLPARQSSALIRVLYKQPLPSFYQSLGPMPLLQALNTLSGRAYQVVVDPVHRLVTFKLRLNYQAL